MQIRTPLSLLLAVSVPLLGIGCGEDGLSMSMAGGSGAAMDEAGEPNVGTRGGAAPPAFADAAAEGEGEAEPDDPGNDGDRYEDVGTNPFVVASHDPLSTFAADVDTASYDIFRRDVENGYLPQRFSVRLEEYVNSFAYGYDAPEPDDAVPFAVTLEAAPSPYAAGRTVVSIGIQGRKPHAQEKRPANLVFLVDVSGSMQGAVKLPLVQQLLLETLDVLDPTDRVAIVTYAGNTAVRLPSTPVSERQEIEGVLNDLKAGGSTNGAGGIMLAYDQAEQNFIDGGINHVILCTDGDFNVGVSHDEGLVGLIEEKRRSGVTFTALGFGTGNLNDSMMEATSNAGNGIYGVISSERNASDYVNNRMLSTLELIAKDVKIQVEINPDEVYAYRLLGYENRAIADDDFRDDKVDAGEIGAGHTVTALYELVLQGDNVPQVDGAPELDEGATFDGEFALQADDLVRIRMRYKDVDATEDDEAYEIETAVKVADVAASYDDASGDFRFATSVAALAEILKGSPYADAAGIETISAVATAEAGDAADRAEFRTLLEAAAPMIAR